MSDKEDIDPRIYFGSDLSCVTDLVTTKTTFTWRIKGTALDEEAGRLHDLQGIKTEEFTIKVPGHRDSKWMMEIKPGTIVDSFLNCDPIKISLHSKNPGTIHVQLSLSIGDSWDTWRGDTLRRYHTFIGESSCELELDHEVNDVWSVLEDDDVKIVLDFTFPLSSSPLRSESESSALEDERKTDQIMKNFEQFFMSREMSDIQLKCGDKTFDAHQVVLSAWSPVFRGMFQAEMKEKETKTVEIQDLEPDVMLEMLKFFYTGSCNINEKNPDPVNVMGILKAADKYQVDGLKNKCEEVMISILEPNNCLRILDCADMYGAQNLKTKALALVVSNMKTIKGSDEWKECVKKRPHLIVEVLADCV